MSADRPVVKESMIFGLVTRELFKLTTLLVFIPLFFEPPLLFIDLRSLHNLHPLVRSPQSQASEASYGGGCASFSSLKSTGRHGGVSTSV